MWTVPGLFWQSLAAQGSFVDGSEGVRENIHWKMLCGMALSPSGQVLKRRYRTRECGLRTDIELPQSSLWWSWLERHEPLGGNASAPDLSLKVLFEVGVSGSCW